MPPRWREGLPTGAITAGSPVQAHIVCPVDTLVDVGLVVSPAGWSAARVQVSVTAGGRVVGRGRLDGGRAQPIQYVRVDLDSPLRGLPRRRSDRRGGVGSPIRRRVPRVDLSRLLRRRHEAGRAA